MSSVVQAQRHLFVATICVGSFLLFLVQPMIARMALPRLGGAPNVWNSAMLVYQALLLCGYAWAHWLGRLSTRMQGRMHIAVFVLAALMLPIGLRLINLSPTANPIFWVPWLFASSIGPLFIVVAAQAPLIQRWYALTGGDNPYPLYSASNMGSFAGLLTYPVLVEPFMPLLAQRWLWSVGYLVVGAMTLLCALRLPETPARMAAVTSPAPGRGRILGWVIKAAIPSGLMLATTTALTTDILAMPLLWVIPLGIYLLSFTIAFAERRALANSLGGVAPILLLAGAGVAFIGGAQFPFAAMMIVLAVLLSVSVAVHAELYESRPDNDRLTSFYLATAAGGAIGGIFCALVAPAIFNWTYELPILLIAAAMAISGKPLFGITARLWDGRRSRIAALAVVAVAGLVAYASIAEFAFSTSLAVLLSLILLGLAAIGNRWAFTGVIVAGLLAVFGWHTIRESFLSGTRQRSFFGVYTVSTNDWPARVLVHGTTVHGYQSLKPGRARDPLSYYAPKSGVGVAFANAEVLYGKAARIGVVGLGSGTLACYAKPGQSWRFYEIDPLMVQIAMDPSKFTYLANCLPKPEIVLGDARLTLAREPAGGLDMLAVDAFSSDSIPMHLLTQEALATYARRLTPHGLLLIHISNRFLDLEPVLAASANQGWHLSVRNYAPTADESSRGYTPSTWVALARDPHAIQRLEGTTGKANWRAAKPRPGYVGWSDDYGSILPTLKALQ